jgi:hypothetical protein
VGSRRVSGGAVAVLLTGSLLSCESGPPPLSVEEAVDSVSVDSFLTHLAALSSDAMAGRRPGTPGYDSAAAYVIRVARDIGLEPGGVDETYRQPITFRRARVDGEAVAFSVAGTELEYGVDFSVSPRVMSTETDVQAPMVFAGFGISAPDLGYDDLDGIDVDGKLVVLIAGWPTSFGSLERTVLSSSAARDAELIARGASGVIVARFGEAVASVSLRPRIRFLPPDEHTGVGSAREELDVSVVVPWQVLATWMSRAGRGSADVLASMQAGSPSSFDFGFDGRVRARYLHDTFESANVAARLPGSDPELRDEHLILTAHLDHLGVGAPVEGDSIYNGTLDNASGSAALLTLASSLRRMDRPRRSVLFLWVTVEESGLLGSEYFARFPTVPRDNVVANQNIDGVMGMIAAATDVLAFGYEHSNLSEAVDFAVARTGTPVSPDPTPEENLFIRSDQYSFVRQGIPAIWVQAGRSSVDPSIDAQAELDAWIVERYHAPTDDGEQPIDLQGVRAELENNLLVMWHITNQMGPIRWETDSFLFRRFGR